MSTYDSFLDDVLPISSLGIDCLFSNDSIFDFIDCHYDCIDSCTHTDALVSALSCGCQIIPFFVYSQVVSDSLFFSISIPSSYINECYVFNTTGFLPSIYSGFNFDSFCLDGNDVLACSDDGIYLLSGDTDNGVPINTGIIFTRQTFGISNKKKFRQVFFGCSGTPSINVRSDSGSETHESSRNRCNITRLMIGVSWEFRISGFLDFDFVEIFPITRTR